MFRYWGTKRVDKELGFAADFCPICRSIQEFRIIQVGKAAHVHGIAMGSGALVCHHRSCTKCGILLNANPVIYAEIAKHADAPDLQTLIRTTCPDIATFYADRLRAEAILMTDPGKLDPKERTTLLTEPFLLMASSVETRFGKLHIDLFLVGIMGFTIVAFGMSEDVMHSIPIFANNEGKILIGILIAGGIGAYLQSIRAGRHFLRRKIYPKLATALRPLKPTDIELRSVLSNLSQSNASIGKNINVRELLQIVALD